MADTGLNKKISGISIKWWILGGGAAALTVWYVYKRQTANATSTDTTATDTSGYGDFSAADGGAYASNYGTPSSYGYLDPTTGQFIGVGGSTTVSGPGTNSAWTQAAAAYLIMQGYDPITVLTALGKYLAGQAVTQSEYNIVTTAIGIEGQPPDGAPPLHMIPPTQTPPPAAKVPSTPRASKVGNNIVWTPSIGVSHYHIRSTKGDWAHNAPATTLRITAPRKGSYTVSAINAAGSSNQSNVVTF